MYYDRENWNANETWTSDENFDAYLLRHCSYKRKVMLLSQKHVIHSFLEKAFTNASPYHKYLFCFNILHGRWFQNCCKYDFMLLRCCTYAVMLTYTSITILYCAMYAWDTAYSYWHLEFICLNFKGSFARPFFPKSVLVFFGVEYENPWYLYFHY